MLNAVDLAILQFINHSLVNPVCDWIFVTISQSWFLLGILSILSLAFIIKDKTKGLMIVILSLVCFAATDSSTSAMKKLFCRPRPCQTLSDLRTINGCGGKYGFPSNHASNTAGFAFLISIFYRKLKPYLWALSSLVCLSRIYLGKHYPSDVIGGIFWGILVSFLIVIISKWLIKRLSNNALLTGLFAK